MIKGVGAGTATITVKTTDGSNITKKCKVTVASPVTGVKLSKSEASVAAGKMVALKATVNPSTAADKNVTWSSSDKTVAAVSSTGVVTGKKAGSAVITATTKEGKKTAACKVTVTK
jgi:uncharacterized protein YjdB